MFGATIRRTGRSGKPPMKLLRAAARSWRAQHTYGGSMLD